MEKFIKDFKKFGRCFLMLILVVGGIIAAATSMNYGVSSGGSTYVVAGILDLIIIGYAAYVFYMKHVV